MHKGLGLLIPMLLGLAIGVQPMAAHADGGCQYVLGFKALHDLLPVAVGDCQDNQAYAANGDALQHGRGGLLVWRKADNWTAFTDGYRSWVNGPYGLEQRLNTERFYWEPDAGAPGTTYNCTVLVHTGVEQAWGFLCQEAGGDPVKMKQLGDQLVAQSVANGLTINVGPGPGIPGRRPAALSTAWRG